MSKYLNRIYNTGLLNEQEPADIDAIAVEPPVEPAPAGDETQVTKLSPESEVLLIRLLKKAMVMKLDPEDIDQIGGLSDVNETNAKDVLTKITKIMKTYSTEIDLDV